MNKMLNICGMLILLGAGLNASEQFKVAVRRLEAANAELYDTQIKLQEDIRLNPDIPAAGNRQDVAGLTLYDQARYARRKNLVHRYLQAKQTFQTCERLLNEQLDLEQKLDQAGVAFEQNDAAEEQKQAENVPAEQAGWIETIVSLPYNAWNAWWGR